MDRHRNAKQTGGGGIRCKDGFVQVDDVRIPFGFEVGQDWKGKRGLHGMEQCHTPRHSLAVKSGVHEAYRGITVHAFQVCAEQFRKL